MKLECICGILLICYLFLLIFNFELILSEKKWFNVFFLDFFYYFLKSVILIFSTGFSYLFWWESKRKHGNYSWKTLIKLIIFFIYLCLCFIFTNFVFESNSFIFIMGAFEFLLNPDFFGLNKIKSLFYNSFFNMKSEYVSFSTNGKTNYKVMRNGVYLETNYYKAVTKWNEWRKLGMSATYITNWGINKCIWNFEKDPILKTHILESMKCDQIAFDVKESILNRGYYYGKIYYYFFRTKITLFESIYIMNKINIPEMLNYEYSQNVYAYKIPSILFTNINKPCISWTNLFKNNIIIDIDKLISNYKNLYINNKEDLKKELIFIIESSYENSQDNIANSISFLVKSFDIQADKLALCLQKWREISFNVIDIKTNTRFNTLFLHAWDQAFNKYIDNILNLYLYNVSGIWSELHVLNDLLESNNKIDIERAIKSITILYDEQVKLSIGLSNIAYILFINNLINENDYMNILSLIMKPEIIAKELLIIVKNKCII